MRKVILIFAFASLAISGLSCSGNKAEADDTQHLLTVDERTKSLQHYQQRMTFSNKKAKEFCNNGIALLEKGDNASAKRLLLKALALEPENAIVLTSLGHASYATQNYGDALEYYNRSHIMYDPENLNAGVHLGRSYYLNGEYQKCIIISKYTASHTEDEKSYYMSNYNLTKALIKVGKCDEAKKSFKDTKPAINMFKDLSSRIHVLEHELRSCKEQ